MLATHLIGHELGHNILQIARDGGVLTDAQKAELAQLFQNKDGSFDEEQFAEAFARELTFALAKAQGQRAERAPKTRVGKALKPIVDFFVALAASVRNWRVGRGMDAETGAPLQAQSVLEAFLQRRREEAKEMAELNRRRWAQSKKDGAALAEALERSPHQIVLDDDGTPLKFHINKETRDNWDQVILALEFREDYPLDQQWWSTPKTMFYGAPDIIRFINAKNPGLFKTLTGEEFNEQLSFMIDPSTLIKIYEGTSGRSVGTAHDHNLTIEDLYRLIDEIDSPLAVFRDVSGNGESLIFLTQLTEKSVANGRVYEDPVIVPIRISQSRDGGIAHYRISSAYGIGNRKRNAILDELGFNPKTALYINRKKLNAIAGNNMARFGRGGSRNQTAHGHGTWRFAHDILNKLSSARTVPDEVGLSRFAPDWATPSVPSIIDQTEAETQEKNNEQYHIKVWSGAPQAYAVPSMAFVGSGTGGNNEGRGLYSSGVRGVAQDRYARYAVWDFEDRIVVSYDGDVLMGKDDDDLFSVPLMFADEVKREAIEALQAKNDIDVPEIAKRAKEAVAADLERLAQNAQKKLESANRWGANAFGPRFTAQRLLEQTTAKLQELEELDVAKVELELPPHPAVMEQTWFTNRPEGDMSHLLSWFESVTPEQMDWIVEAAEKTGFTDKEIAFLWGRHKKGETTPSSRSVYMRLEAIFHSREHNRDLADYTSSDLLDIHEDMVFEYGKQASEFLLTADIDGVRYPVDYRKGVMDGSDGWNYVAFSDEHLRVDHVYEYNPETDDFEQKWHDPTAAQYKATERAQLEKSLEDALGQTGESRKGKIKVVRFFIGLPPILAQCGLRGAGIDAIPSKLKYIRDHHHLDAAALAELPARLENPVAVFQTNGGRLAVLTDLLADDGTGRMAPVMAVLEHGDTKRNARLVTAYSRTANSEGYYQEAFRDKEALRFRDTKRVALLPKEPQ